MANNANMGFEHRFAFGASPATFGGSSTRLEVVTSSVKKQGEHLDGTGVLGTRTKREDRTRDGLVRVGGQMVFEPSLRIWDFFLPFILGETGASPYNVADALTGFDMLHDPFGTGENATKFGELYVNRASLRFGPGMLKLSLDLIGKTVTIGQTYTSAALGATALLDAPLVLYDATFSVQSGTVPIEEGELIIDNALDVKFRNSQTALSIRAMDRSVTLVTNIELTAANWGTYFGDKAAVDATITIARSINYGSVITLYNLKNPDEGPELGGHGEVPLILRSAARGDASDPDIRVTTDLVL